MNTDATDAPTWLGGMEDLRALAGCRTEEVVISDYLDKEVRLGRVVGPLPGDTAVHISRFGVVPKLSQPGKWRLIIDLSAPENHSVNDGIAPESCTLSYTTVDCAAELVRSRGRGALLAKLDIESAYRIVPIHPDDRCVLGMRWKGAIYIDTCLPFGLRLAPKIFTALADALGWIFTQHGVRDVIHYLDDFLIVGDPGSSECSVALNVALELCGRLGVPIAEQKLQGPTTSLSFLGIEVDTMAMELRLPQEKLGQLKVMIQDWNARKSCSKRELLSLIGRLQHACKVVRSGSFLRRMINLSTVAKKLHHHIRLSKSFRADLSWWSVFLESRNGVSVLNWVVGGPPAFTLTSDASGSWGCGAFSSSGEWFAFEWPPAWSVVNITAKELFPLVVACAIWGVQWQGKVVRCLCDNAAVVAIVKSGSSKDNLVMHLVRTLFYFNARKNIHLYVEHIAGSSNLADSLSRNNIPLFIRQVPTAATNPTPIPVEARQLLLSQEHDWTSEIWTTLLSSISRKA